MEQKVEHQTSIHVKQQQKIRCPFVAAAIRPIILAPNNNSHHYSYYFALVIHGSLHPSIHICFLYQVHSLGPVAMQTVKPWLKGGGGRAGRFGADRHRWGKHSGGAVLKSRVNGGNNNLCFETYIKTGVKTRIDKSPSRQRAFQHERSRKGRRQPERPHSYLLALSKT